MQNASGQNASGQNISGQNISEQNISEQNISGQNTSGQKESFLEVRNLDLDVGGFELRDISLRAEEGDYVAVIGPSGSGKSLLLETLIGFYSPESGRVFLEGRDITDFTPDKRQISIVYQDHVLFPHMTVFENIAYALRKKLRDKTRIEEEVRRIAGLLEISHLLTRKPTTLSGGEKQRTALARGLVVRPKLLLLDEPFSALDVRTKERLREVLKNAIKEYSTTVLHVTHDFDDLWALADRVLIIRNGKVMQEGTPEAVFRRPSPDFVAEFLGTNLLKGRVRKREGKLTVLEVEGENPGLKHALTLYSSDSGEPGEEVSVSIRPEEIILAGGVLESSARNMLKGKVRSLMKKEHLVNVNLELETGTGADSGLELRAVITPTSCEMMGLDAGKEVYTVFKAANVRIIR